MGQVALAISDHSSSPPQATSAPTQTEYPLRLSRVSRRSIGPAASLDITKTVFTTQRPTRPQEACRRAWINCPSARMAELCRIRSLWETVIRNLAVKRKLRWIVTLHRCFPFVQSARQHICTHSFRVAPV